MPDRRFIHTHPGFGYRFQPQPAAGTVKGAAAAAPDGSMLSQDVHIQVPAA